MEGNDRSRRVMEKVGMQFEGIARDSMLVKGKYVTIGTCAVLKQDYLELYGMGTEHRG